MKKIINLKIKETLNKFQLKKVRLNLTSRIINSKSKNQKLIQVKSSDRYSKKN
jgi:hypothetical protein